MRLKIQRPKRRRLFIDYGCGFPVILLNVPMVKVFGVKTPDINYRKYAEAVLHALANKPTRLTGNEIRFIRLESERTLKDFALRFGQTSHQAVMKWERCRNRPTKMAWSIEKDIRLSILESLDVDPRRFRILYSDLTERMSRARHPVRVDGRLLAA